MTATYALSAIPIGHRVKFSHGQVFGRASNRAKSASPVRRFRSIGDGGQAALARVRRFLRLTRTRVRARQMSKGRMSLVPWLLIKVTQGLALIQASICASAFHLAERSSAGRISPLPSE